MKIEHPWKSGACDECKFHNNSDMCMAYLTKSGLCNMYCPNVIYCEKYHRTYEIIGMKENSNHE